MSPFLFSCQFMSVNLLIYSIYEENHDVIEILDFPNDYEILNYDERVFIFAFQER